MSIDRLLNGRELLFPADRRIVNVHKNVPGVLRDINKIASDLGANIQAQHLATDQNIGYLIMDIEKSDAIPMGERISHLSTNIRTRIV